MADNLGIDGERTKGEDIRAQNVTAVMAVANIVKSSLGPVGLDKMLVDDIGDVTITNDGATILKLLEIEHPAAKVLVELSELQDKEVGDGTTSVVIVAAELLKRALSLVKQRIHPTSIISGYRLAMREAIKFLKKNLVTKSDALDDQMVLNSAKTSMSSKIIGLESDFFARMCVDAVKMVETEDLLTGKKKYPVKAAISVLKCHGKSAMESELLDGLAINATRSAQGMPQVVKNAKIALLDFDLRHTKMGMGIQVQITDPEEVEKIRKREADIIKERVQMILAAGANVVFTTKGIDDLCLKYFVEAKAIACRRVTKRDIQRISKATGAELVSTLGTEEGGEEFLASCLGEAREVVEKPVGDSEILCIMGCKQRGAATLLMRGANDFMLDEMDRSMHDALCVVKRVLESKSLVAGGGAVETSLSVYLENYALGLDGREQLAVAEFAQALLVIPRVLSVNAAKDATDLVAKLRSMHYKAQVSLYFSATLFLVRMHAQATRISLHQPTMKTDNRTTKQRNNAINTTRRIPRTRATRSTAST